MEHTFRGIKIEYTMTEKGVSTKNFTNIRNENGIYTQEKSLKKRGIRVSFEELHVLKLMKTKYWNTMAPEYKQKPVENPILSQTYLDTLELWG